MKINNLQPTKLSEYEKLVCDNVRMLRMSKNVTKKELAANIGVSQQQLHKYEKSTNRMSAGRLVAIAKALDIPVENFCQRTSENCKSATYLKLFRHLAEIENSQQQQEALHDLIKSISQSQEN